MAANDEFPRGWVRNTIQSASGVAPVITVPAIPGIGHVLTDVFIKWTNFNVAVAGQHVWTVNVSGVIVNGLLALTANLEATDSITLAGIKMATPTGGAIAITTDAPAAGQFVEITAQGYDI